ncbi:MAG: sulfatase-like hydrolase/transferase [Opitutaceae bacterium]
MKQRIRVLYSVLCAGIAACASAETITIEAFSSGTNNTNNHAANATLIRVGGSGSDSSGAVNISSFTGYTTFDLDATAFTESQLQTATFSLDFGLSVFAGSPDNLTVEYLGTFADGAHNQTNVNGGDQSSGWITDTALNTVRTGAISTGDIVTTATTLDSASFGERYAVFRYSLDTVLGDGDDIQWSIADSGEAIPQLTVTVESTGSEKDVIKIDFGATAPAVSNWNQFAMTSGATTVENLLRSSDGVATSVGIAVSGISGNGANHLLGTGSSNASIYTDHIFAQNESPDDTLTFTIFGLDDAQTYELSGGFNRNSTNFEHEWTVGADVRTNTFDGTNVDGYETFTGLSPSGGEITFSISDMIDADDWASIAELTISAESFAAAPPVAYAQSLRTPPNTALSLTLTGSENVQNYTVGTQPSFGTLDGVAPDLTYTPNGGFLGSDSFTFTVDDGETSSAEVTVSITVAENGPNFILFLTDDQGYNDLGVQGSPHILTPRIDTLAAEGIRFTSGYVPSPVCGPCRAGLYTGSYPMRIGEHNNQKFHHTEPHADEIMIPELLKTAGYTSALIGKWHNAGEAPNATSYTAGRGPYDQGFDYVYGTPSHNGTHAVDTGSNVNTSILRVDASGTTVVDANLNQTEADQMILNYTNEALDFITEAHTSNKPFFLNLSHNMPHVSLATRQSYRDSAAERGLDVYAAVIEELDWSMGAVLDKLDELGITENTFVIFSSDNGPWASAHLEGYYGSAFPLKGSKMRPLEGGARVPYIVRWPGTITPDVVTDEVVTLMDLFPTFMDYADVEIPEGLEIDGKSIRDLIEGSEDESPHEYYYYYCYTYLFAIRDTRWKLVLPRPNDPYGMWWWAKNIDRVDGIQLYDLDNDKEETTNLAAEYPEVVKRLMDQIEVARSELGDKDRIGTSARFHADPATRRPDVANYIGNAPAPYVDDPLAGLPAAVKTGVDTALLSYEDADTYTSVELVWAYEDQGQVAASVWQAAEGGGGADLGAKSSSAAIEHELTGLNPFRQYVYRFILTDGSDARWSIPAPIHPERSDRIAYQIGIDFSDGGSTGGSGSEPGWNVVNGNATDATVYDLCSGNTLAGVSIQTSGISGGEMTNADLGVGEADYGNYLDTPFSDLSANDGVWSTSTMTVVISGLDDTHCYDVQLLAMPGTGTALTDLTITAGGLSQVRTYASFRPYINNDAAPYTNSDFVLSSPFYSRPIVVPAIFQNLTTDGAGSLTITVSDDQAIALNAVYITAKAMQPIAVVGDDTQFQFWVDPIPEGQTFHVRSSDNLETFVPMVPAQQITSSTTQPISLPITSEEPNMFYRVHGGSD